MKTNTEKIEHIRTLKTIINKYEKYGKDMWKRTCELDDEIDELWELDMDEEEEQEKREELIGQRNRHQGVRDGVMMVVKNLKEIIKEVK